MEPGRFTRALEALADLEAEQRERYRPAPPPAPTPIEAYARRLGNARSQYVSVDAVG